MLTALHQWAKVSCFLLLFAASAAYSVVEQLELNHDSAVYILLTQSLVSGDGYRNLYVVDSPPHTKYPPVFPLLLAPVVYLFELNFWAMRLFVVTIGIIALYVVYTLFRRMAGGRLAFTILVLTGVSHGVWLYSQSILSEIPYLLFSFLGLFLLERYKEERTRMLGKAWMVALTIGVASLTRTIGLALLAGGVAYIALEREKGEQFYSRQRLTKSGLLAALASVPITLWFLRNWMVSIEAGPIAYLQEYGLKDYASIDSRITGFKDFMELIYHNLYIYIISCAKIVLPYFPWLSEKVSGILVTTIVVAGFFICLIKKRTVLEYYVVLYSFALILFPAAYPRYLVPLIPMIWYYFLAAMQIVIRLLIMRYSLLKKLEAFDPVCYVSVILLLCIYLTSSVWASILKSDGDNDYQIDKAEKIYGDILPWVKENTGPDSVFIWSKPALRYLLSERKAAPLFTTTDQEQVLAAIEDAGVDYAVVDSFSDRSLLYLKPIVENHPARFSLVYQNGASMVYKVER